MSQGPPPPAPEPYPAGWYPDPSGRYDHRWYDGTQWTHHVASDGTQTVDPEGIGPTIVPRGDQSAERVRDQVQRQAGVPAGADASAGSLLDQSVLVVNQKAKLVEVSNEYAVYDQQGTQIGAVRQVGQSTARKVLRFVTDVDQFLTHRLEVTDTAGRTLLRVTRPAKVFKSTVVVEDPGGREIGRIVQQNVFGKIRFELEAHGQRVGALNAENWRAWDFHIVDQTETEVARIKKTWEGIARTMFTTADNYVVRIHRPLQDPLRSLVVASALTVDTALKQDSRGFN
jgi:uncharacterized protein YxjI